VIEAESDVTIEFSDERHIAAILEALKPELRVFKRCRSRIKISRNGTALRLKFSARDPVALRASVNLYLRSVLSWRRTILIIVAISIVNVLQLHLRSEKVGRGY